MGKHKAKRDSKRNKGASRAASRSATTREKAQQARRKRKGLEFNTNA
jgi:hypothetical protein